MGNFENLFLNFLISSFSYWTDTKFSSFPPEIDAKGKGLILWRKRFEIFWESFLKVETTFYVISYEPDRTRVSFSAFSKSTESSSFFKGEIYLLPGLIVSEKSFKFNFRRIINSVIASYPKDWFSLTKAFASALNLKGILFPPPRFVIIKKLIRKWVRRF